MKVVGYIWWVHGDATWYPYGVSTLNTYPHSATHKGYPQCSTHTRASTHSGYSTLGVSTSKVHPCKMVNPQARRIHTNWEFRHPRKIGVFEIS